MNINNIAWFDPAEHGKIVIGIIACLFGVLILMLAAIFIATKLIDNEVVKAKLHSEIKETTGVEIDFKHLALDFFPHPHVIFDQVTLSIPQVVRGEAVSVRVHPKILPLFLGKMQISSLRLDSAELDYTLPKKPATGKIALQPSSLHDQGKRIRSNLTLLVAPLVTLDRIFEHIPLIGEIPSTLDTIPLSAKGTLDNLHIYPLTPSAVEYELKEMMRKTIERPINVIYGGKTPEQN